MAGRAGLPEVRVFCGPARSDRPARVLDYLHAHWGRALLIVPNNRLATLRVEDLLLSSDQPGMWGQPAETFQAFASRLLQGRDVNTNLLTEFERRTILERAIDTVRGRDELGGVAGVSETPGFVNHLLRIITQLKQAAVEPAEFRMRAAQCRHEHWLNPVVAAVYEAYQSALIVSGRYDLVGLYWQAELACRETRPPALETVGHVVLDGFDDFTPSEFRLIQSVAPHLDALVFSMSCSLGDASQGDLYQTPRQTLSKVQKAFDARLEEFLESPPKRLTHYVARNLFWRDFPDTPPDVVDLELAVYVNPIQEAESIARRIKRLILDESIAPAAIGVVYRDLNENAAMIGAVFDEAGIPATIDLRPALAQSGVGRFLTALLEVPPAWRRDQVLEVIASPWFAPGHPRIAAHRATFATLARAAQITAGRRDWETKPRLTTGNPELPTLLGASRDAIAGAISGIEAAVALLRDTLDALEAARDEHAFIDALAQAAESLEIEGGIAALPDPAWRDRERAALRTLHDVVDKVRGWSAPTGDGRGYRDHAARFGHAMAAASYDVQQPRDGVQVMAVEAARHLQFDHVFFCGLVEGVVPQPPPSSAIYTDSHITEFEQVGICLDSKHGRNARERLLFHHMLGLPRARLYLSWHARSREDKEIGASPFIADVRELLGPCVAVQDRRIATTPGIEDAASARDVRNAAAAFTYVIPGCEALLEPVKQRAALEQRRHEKAAFDAYDGVIAAADLVRLLQQRFGSEHRFSARQLEAYARCPFRFLTQEIFRIAPVEDPAPELDAMLRGLIMHDALQRFHAQFRGQAISTLVDAEARPAMRAAVGAAFAALVGRDQAMPRGVVAAESARMTRQLLRYLDIERRRNERWLPLHFEVSFGRSRKPGAGSHSREEPFVLQTSAGPVLVAGVIDRIDEQDGALRILDYKSSVAPHTKDALDNGVDLQLLLYAAVVEDHLCQGQICTHAQYVQVGRTHRRETLGDGAARRKTMVDKVGAYVQAMRAGIFPPKPYKDACSYCAMRRVCRYEAGRIARKEPAP
jgi:ATP-dependent helicase/nuclease subunit B